MIQGSDLEDFYFSLVDRDFFTYVAEQTNETLCKEVVMYV